MKQSYSSQYIQANKNSSLSTVNCQLLTFLFSVLRSPFSVLLLSFLLFPPPLSHAQSWQYAHHFGGNPGNPILGTNNNPYNLITDDYGNAYVFGTYGAFTEFDGVTLPAFGSNQGSFIVKYNCAGEVEWFKAISNAEAIDDQGSHMILKDNYLYLMGTTQYDRYYRTWFLDTLVYGNLLSPPYTYPYRPTDYTYIIKMDIQTGLIVDWHLLNLISTVRWNNFVSLVSLWVDASNKRGFTIDDEGNYYIPARFHSHSNHKLYCDNVLIIDSVELNTVGDIAGYIPHILKFDSSFNLLWYKPLFSHTSDPELGTPYFDITDMYCSEDNQIYMTGYAVCGEGYMSYDNSEIIPITFPLSLYFMSGDSILLNHSNGEVGYLLKMDNNGDVLWCRQSQGFSNRETGSSSSNFETLSVYEETDDIYVSGYGQVYNELWDDYSGDWLILGTIIGGQDTVMGLSLTASGNMGIIVNYDLNGNYKGYVNPNTWQGYISRARVYDNKIYAATSWRIELQHGGSTYNYAIGTTGLALCSWDRQFNPIDCINIPSTGNQNMRPKELSVNNRGEITIAGNFDNNLTFGEHYISTGGAQRKMFIAKYGFLCPTNGESYGEFCYGDVYEGVTLTHSGNYTFTYPSSTPGIDSVHTLHATVLPQITSGLLNSIACKDSLLVLQATTGYDTYLWSTGETSSSIELTYNQTGTHTLYLTMTQGECSGTDTITITVENCQVGIAEQKMSNIVLYPNPVTDICHIHIGNEQLKEIRIYDIYGREVAVHTTLKFSTKELSAGIYIVKVHTTNGKIGQKKMVKQK